MTDFYNRAGAADNSAQETGEIYTVSQLNRETRFLLEKNFSTLWIEGEISNFSVPASGHWYFSLKDQTAQVRCAMFRPQHRQLGWKPQEGAHVLARVQVSLYEGRGDFQLLVNHLEAMGEGRLRQAFEALRKKLAAEGLFDASHKKPLPAFPACIGVITSATGAAIHDILSVLARRYPCAMVRVYPAQVQGLQAAATLIAALDLADQEQYCDVLILARGGGSIEDLWPFNEEALARAIARNHIPLVTGVGHETDFTIADFVADLRAPTPSVAAESVSPDARAWLQKLAQTVARLERNFIRLLQHFQQQLDFLEKRLQRQHPLRKLAEKRQQLEAVSLQLNTRVAVHFQRLHQQLAMQAARLAALSPLAVLGRGFAMATTWPDRRLLKNAADVRPGQQIRVSLAKGLLECTVDRVRKKHEPA